jgi:putative ABC transport system permease protein
MRPPSPARYRRGLLERLGLGAIAGPSGLMVLREIRRAPLRTALSSIGIAGAIALIILGRFGTDSIENYLEGTLRREQRQDLQVAFGRPAHPRVVGELARASGVLTAEGVRSVPVRARHDHLMREAVLLGLPRAATLRRLIARDGHAVAIPVDGVLVTRTLGEILNVGVGDRLELEVREGERPVVRPVVVGLVDDAVGLTIYARASLVADLEGDVGAISSVLLDVEPHQVAAVEARLRRSPHVIDVSDLDADIQRLRDMNGSMMDVWTAVSITLAACVIFGVVYNNARISLAARSRDLATLRVLGLSRAEVASILIGGLALDVAFAIPLGLLLGRGWAESFMNAIDRETFRWTVAVEPRTYATAAAVALVAAAASALLVRRKLDRLDLIEVVKTRE